MDSAYQIVTRNLAEHFEVDPARLTPETTLEQLELDSLSILEFGLLLQEETGVRRLDEGVVTFRTTLGAIAATLDNQRTGGSAGTEVRMVTGAVLAGDR
ncbi:acyl carrier protein [Actinoplanes sp. HUAS TT8]|uniref:acyl carrier protein n=1 Tax=Actinoplanes sp. HUAS TT8 TaxID=3447453 RepID=UPI003F52609E